VGVWIGCVWIGMGTGGRSCERSGEPYGSTGVGEFLDSLLRKDSAPVGWLVGYATSNAINS
jgi:hypothetical protein